MCPVVLFAIVNHCKSPQSLTASYKVIQKPIKKSYTSHWQAKPHLVNTHASTLHLHRIRMMVLYLLKVLGCSVLMDLRNRATHFALFTTVS